MDGHEKPAAPAQLTTTANNITLITKSLQLRFDSQAAACYKYVLINARLIGVGKYEEK